MRIPGLIAALISLLLSTDTRPGADADPHRPTCRTAQCRKVKSFLKAHYCGESPYGNGPADGCLLVEPKKLGAGFKITADFHCEWMEHEEKAQCQQRGEVRSHVKDLLVREMKRLGVPAGEDKQVLFASWESNVADFSIAKAAYSSIAGAELAICAVVLRIDRTGHVVVLREVPFHRTDVDVPDVATWALLDVADVDGDGYPEVILHGDAYENHWLEVVSMRSGAAKTIFSGLGYYL